MLFNIKCRSAGSKNVNAQTCVINKMYVINIA